MRDSELDDVRVCLEEELLAVEAAEKEPPSYAPERQRFYILAVLSLFSFCQCLNWFTFSSVDPAKVEAYYGAAVGGQAAIDMLLNWGPVAGIAFFPVQLWLLERRDGLRKNVVAGAWGTAFVLQHGWPRGGDGDGGGDGDNGGGSGRDAR